MTNDCFAHGRRWTEGGECIKDENSLCSALRKEAAQKYVNEGKCGNVGCPFYKPEDKTNLIRIGTAFYIPKR